MEPVRIQEKPGLGQSWRWDPSARTASRYSALLMKVRIEVTIKEGILLSGLYISRVVSLLECSYSRIRRRLGRAYRPVNSYIGGGTMGVYVAEQCNVCIFICVMS
jgi:hypothetical protein